MPIPPPRNQAEFLAALPPRIFVSGEIHFPLLQKGISAPLKRLDMNLIDEMVMGRIEGQGPQDAVTLTIWLTGGMPDERVLHTLTSSA